MKAKISLLMFSGVLILNSSVFADERIKIKVNFPNVNPPVINQPFIADNDNFGPDQSDFQFRRHKSLRWVDSMQGMPIPPNAVQSGYQIRPRSMLYVCRANYQDGVHPGKLLAGNCNISWGGREIAMPRYQILTSRRPLSWAPARFGQTPPNAVAGGFEDGHPLYICQAQYRNGVHSGKVVGQACNIPWGGKEVTIPFYNVLVR